METKMENKTIYNSIKKHKILRIYLTKHMQNTFTKKL